MCQKRKMRRGDCGEKETSAGRLTHLASALPAFFLQVGDSALNDAILPGFSEIERGGLRARWIVSLQAVDLRKDARDAGGDIHEEQQDCQTQPGTKTNQQCTCEADEAIDDTFIYDRPNDEDIKETYKQAQGPV